MHPSLVCCFSYAGGCGSLSVFLPVPPFISVARLLALARAMRPRAWSPGFSPPPHYCGSSAQGFSLLRVRLTPCNAWAAIRFIRGLPGFMGALQGLPRTLPDPGHPGCFTFRSEVWLQALRTPPHGDALPVTYCFPPIGRSLDFNHAALQAARRTKETGTNRRSSA